MKKTIAFLFSLIMIMSLAACGNSSGRAEQNPAENNSVESSVPEETSVPESSTAEPEPETEATQSEETESAPETDTQTAAPDPAQATETEPLEEAAGSNILIAYFTYAENAELPDDVDASTEASIQIFNGEVTGNTGLMAHLIAEATGAELFSIRTAELYPDNYDETIDVGQAEKNDGVRPELSAHIENPEQYDTIFVGFPNWWYGMPMVMYSFFEEYDFSGKTLIPFCTSGGSAFSDAIDEIKNMEPGATVLDGLHIGRSGISDVESRVNEWVAELGLSK